MRMSTNNSFRVIRAYLRLPPAPGGMEAHIARLTAAQRDLGIQVLNLYNVGVAEEPAVRLLPRYDLRRIRPAALRNGIFYAAAIICRDKLKDSYPTVLHIHGDAWDFIYGRLLAYAIGAAAVTASLHGIAKKNKAWLYRVALAKYDLIFVTGKKDQVFLETLLGRAVYHLPSAPLDVFFDRQGTHASPCYDVITVANCVAKKRLDLVLDCAACCPDLKFAVYGDGPLRPSLMEQVRIRDIKNLWLAGSKPPEEVAKGMRNARVFLLTSEAEGTPTAAIEAMASGLPVVITPSNDYSWLIDQGVNGYVTSSWEVNEVINRIRDVMLNEGRRVSMGQVNYVRAKQHTWLANAERVSKLMAGRLGIAWGQP